MLTTICRDILYDLANVGNLPLPQSPIPSHKRTRSSEASRSAATSPTPEEHSSPQLRHIAGSRRVQQYQQASHTFSPMLFSLPIHSDELGRLPLHPFFQPNTADGSIDPSDAPPPWLPQNFASMSNPPAPPVDSNISGNPIDSATLDALFRMLPPTSYQQAMVPPDPGAAAGPQEYPNVGPIPSQHQSLTSVLSENIGSLIAHTNAPVSAAPVGQESGFAPADNIESDTLAIWSNAPSSFEYVQSLPAAPEDESDAGVPRWEDWNTYITNFGGSAGPSMGGAGNS